MIVILYLSIIISMNSSSRNFELRMRNNCILNVRGLTGTTKNIARWPTKQEENCWLACMDKRMGLMNQDGSYNESFILANNQDVQTKLEVNRKFNYVMKMCNAEAGQDVYILAGCIHMQPRDFYL